MAKKRRHVDPFEDIKVMIPYVRQSRARIGEQEDTSLSLDSQAETIRSWGQRMGYTVEPAIRDHEEDSETADREGLKELFATVRPGVTVAVELWDRLGRGWIMDEIVREIEDRGGRAVSVVQGSDPLARDMHGVLGKEYLRQLSSRLKSVSAQRVARGVHVGETPFGYDRPTRVQYMNRRGEWKTRHSGPLVINPETAPIIERIFTRWNAGDTLRNIAETLERDGVPGPSDNGWVPQTIRWMLTNPVYAGAVRGRDQVTWNAMHDPIISRETWATAQLRLERSVTTHQKDDPHWCERLVWHSCGARMTLNMVSRPGGGRYPSFRCADTARTGKRRCVDPRQHIGAPLLERSIRACLVADLAAVRSVPDAIAVASEQVGAPAAELERARLTALLEENLAVRARARASYLKGKDTLEEWSETSDACDLETARINRELARLPQHPDRRLFESAAKTLETLGDLIKDAEGDELHMAVTELGVAIVDRDGVHIRYWHPYSNLVITPAIVDPRMPFD